MFARKLSFLLLIFVFGNLDESNAQDAVIDGQKVWHYSPEEVEKFGPGPTIHPDSIQGAIETWKWQMGAAKTQQKLIEELEQTWIARSKEDERSLAQFRNEMAKVGVPYPQDKQALDGIEMAIQGLEADRLALRLEWKRVIEEQKAISLEQERLAQSQETEIELLSQKAANLARASALIDQQFTADHPEAKALKVDSQELARLESEIDRRQLAVKKLYEKALQQDGAAVARVADENKRLEQKLETLLGIRKLVAQYQPLETTSRLERRIAHAEKMIEIAQMKRFELALENTRYQALIEQAARQLKSSEKESEK